MDNPYRVLGIREGASEEEIRRAYRELVRKYHPDQYRDNPLADLAQEKLKEINEAYDYLMKNKSNQYNPNRRSGRQGRDSGYSYGYTGEQSPEYQRIRTLINTGNLSAAEAALNRITNRTAEWYYLKGILFMRRGWYGEAQSHLQTAVNMDPTNTEYSNTLNRMIYMNRNYSRNAYGRGYAGGPDLCTMCECLICSDCCCECMGGDLIQCC